MEQELQSTMNLAINVTDLPLSSEIKDLIRFLDQKTQQKLIEQAVRGYIEIAMDVQKKKQLSQMDLRNFEAFAAATRLHLNSLPSWSISKVEITLSDGVVNVKLSGRAFSGKK